VAAPVEEAAAVAAGFLFPLAELLPTFAVLIADEEVFAGATEPLATGCVPLGIELLALRATMPESTDRVFETRSPEVAEEEPGLGEFLLSVNAVAALCPEASSRVDEVKLFLILSFRNATRGSSAGFTVERGTSMGRWAAGFSFVFAMMFTSGLAGFPGSCCFLASADFELTNARASCVDMELSKLASTTDPEPVTGTETFVASDTAESGDARGSAMAAATGCES
jgi:hypothetical protein